MVQPVLMGRIRTGAPAFQGIPDSAVRLGKMFVRLVTHVQMARNADRVILTTFTVLVVPAGSAKSATKDRVSEPTFEHIRKLSLKLRVKNNFSRWPLFKQPVQKWSVY